MPGGWAPRRGAGFLRFPFEVHPRRGVGMPRPIVVASEHLDERWAAWLAERVTLRRLGVQDEGFAEALAEAAGLLVRTYTRVDEALLERAPHLRVVGRAGVGLDNIDLAACRRRNVAVVHTPGANTQAVVEYVFALALDHYRPRPTLVPGTTAERYAALRRESVGRELGSLSLGILGFGRVGRRVGAVAAALGMRLRVHDLIGEAACREAVGGAFDFAFTDLEALLSQSDLVTVHVDGRAENRHLLGAEAFDRLPPHALFVNASRGMVVEEAALLAWAARAAPAGGAAVLDVQDPEPPLPEAPLYGRENVRVLPHLGSRTGQALTAMSAVVKDMVAVLEGREPAGRVGG